MTAGLARVGAGIDASIRPGQLAARADSKKQEWATVVLAADAALNQFDPLDDGAAKARLTDILLLRDSIANKTTPKRSDFVPLAW